MTAPIGVRRNWATMSTADRGVVIQRLQAVKASGRYDELTRLHQRAMMGDGNEWHRRPIILPVHRWFLSQLEAAMGVPVPYWDWVVNRALPPGLGGNGNPSRGNRVTDGPFANWSCVVWNSSTRTFSTRTPAGIIRQVGVFATSLPTATHANGALGQTVYDVSPWNRTSTSGFRNRVEGGTGAPRPAMHDRVHEWIGGDMRAGTSPNDPLFWFHHCQVDRLWAAWQRRRGTTNYQAPAGQRPADVMPLTGGVTVGQMLTPPPYDRLP